MCVVVVHCHIQLTQQRALHAGSCSSPIWRLALYTQHTHAPYTHYSTAQPEPTRQVLFYCSRASLLELLYDPCRGGMDWQLSSVNTSFSFYSRNYWSVRHKVIIRSQGTRDIYLPVPSAINSPISRRRVSQCLLRFGSLKVRACGAASRWVSSVIVLLLLFNKPGQGLGYLVNRVFP